MIALILSSLSLAARLAMEPQNKVHAGASMIGSSYGVALGLDSRLTQLIYIDIGGFISVSDTSDIIPVEDDFENLYSAIIKNKNKDIDVVIEYWQNPSYLPKLYNNLYEFLLSKNLKVSY